MDIAFMYSFKIRYPSNEENKNLYRESMKKIHKNFLIDYIKNHYDELPIMTQEIEGENGDLVIRKIISITEFETPIKVVIDY